MKYFLAREFCQENPLLHFCGSTEHFYIAHSYIYAIKNKKGTRCCVSMSTAVTLTRHTVTLLVHYLV